MREWGPEEGLWGFLLGFVVGVRESSCCLTAEAVQGAALAFEGVDHVHGGHGLPLRVLGVGDGVTDHVLQEHFEDTAGLLVDQAGDTLDTNKYKFTSINSGTKCLSFVLLELGGGRLSLWKLCLSP